MALTERQTQIKTMRDADKPPSEIATALGISVNGVYQTLRRIRAIEGGAKDGAKGTGRKSGGKPAVKAPVPVQASSGTGGSTTQSHVTVTKTMTPLQAIRTRRAEIMASLNESGRALDQAATALTKAQEADRALQAKHAAEIKRLTAAEKALAPPAPAPAPSTTPTATRTAGGRPENGAKAPETAQTAPAAVEDPFAGGQETAEPVAAS